MNNNNNNNSNGSIYNNNNTATPLPSNNTAESKSVPEINNSVNNINTTSVNSINNNINPQPTIQSNQNINNNIPTQNNITTFNQSSDDELVRAFIGNNYEKITTKPFNVAGFFFTTFYMFYRKMFEYALLVFLLELIILNVINNFIVTIAFNIIIGLFINKIYLYYTKKKIAKIKASNPQKSTEELKNICITEGGTSINKIFIGFLTELGIALIVLFAMTLIGIGGIIGNFFNFNNWNITVNNGSNTNNNLSSKKDGTLVENVSVSGYSCFNAKCNISITDSNGNITDYVLNVNNNELIKSLGDYNNYIKLNIYYTKKGNEKTIIDYEIYLKSNNKNISNVKTENELRDKIGLYSIGTHTASLTLTKIGTTGFGFKDNTSYTYTSYTFIDNKNIEYEMTYVNDNNTLNLIEGNKYTVTFEVTEGTFEHEFTIKSIK